MSDNALMVRDTELTISEIKAQVAKIQELMKEVMHDGEHYGVIPGTTKPTLYKAGAEKLGFVFRLRPEFDIVRSCLEGDHREYEVICTLFHMGTGAEIAQGVGNCSTMESKYRYRRALRLCPSCSQESMIQNKYGGGWFCWPKKGGCGAKFPPDDYRIVSQKIGRIENVDIADSYNTVKKIAKKRAHVDSILTACAASDIFSQEEDFRSGATTEEPTEPAEWHEGKSDEAIKAICKRGISTLSKLVEDKKEIGQMIDHLETCSREDMIATVASLQEKVAEAKAAPLPEKDMFAEEDPLKGTPGEVHRSGPHGAIRAD